MSRRSLLHCFLICAAPVTAACGAARGPSGASVSATPDAAQLEALYRARSDSALMRFSEADVAFVRGMIRHHEQALVMADYAETRAADPSVRVLAARIINAQRDEIALMRTWLGDRGRSQGDGTVVHSAPGMLTEDQLQRLEGASGEAFDRLFLTYMIQHHRGAVTMVHELFGTDGAAADTSVFKMASDIQVDQTTEIARMELMLESLGSAPPDPFRGNES